MAETLISTRHSRQIEINSATPAAQLTTDADVVLAGSELTVFAVGPLSYTLRAVTNAITWTVFGGNDSAFSDETIIQSATSVAANATGTFTVTSAPFLYYRVKIRATVAASQGTATLRGVAKG